VFDSFRKSLEDLMNRATPPEERRTIVARMRDTLVQAKASLNDLRDGLAKTRRQLEIEERELATVRRRKDLATGIGDRETVEIATRYEETHAKRVEIVRQKLSAQEAELAMAEREVETMTVELKAAAAGTGSAAPTTPSIDPGVDPDSMDADLRAEIDALRRSRDRSAREADAERRLEELKRRMSGGGGSGGGGGAGGGGR
jgi:chromosome segregation ATPase